MASEVQFYLRETRMETYFMGDEHVNIYCRNSNGEETQIERLGLNQRLEEIVLLCDSKVINHNGRSIVGSLTEANQLVQDGHAYLTRAPPGLFRNNTLRVDLVVSCPVIITLLGNECLNDQNWFKDGFGEQDLAFDQE